MRMSRVFARAAVSGPCCPYDHSSYHTSVCRRLFECCGLVRQCNGGVVDSSAQRGARSARSHVGWEHGAVRWWRNCVARYFKSLCELWVVFMVAFVLFVFACSSIAALFSTATFCLLTLPLQAPFQIAWTYTTVQRGRGRQLSSACRVMN